MFTRNSCPSGKSVQIGAFPELVNIEQIGLIRAGYYWILSEGRAPNASQSKKTSG